MSRSFRFLLPKGRLYEQIQAYLKSVGIILHAPDRRGFCGQISLEGFRVEFWVRKPGMIPLLLGKEHKTSIVRPQCSGEEEEVLAQERVFHAGITGEDMLLESNTSLHIVEKFTFSSRTFQPTRWHLTKLRPDSSANAYVNRMSAGRTIIGCECLHLAKTLLLAKNFSEEEFELVRLQGTEEAAVLDGLCQEVICPVETGQSLEENDLLKGLLLFTSHPCLVVRSGLLQEHMRLAEGIGLVLKGTEIATNRKMVTFDLPMGRLAEIVFPQSVVSPTRCALLNESWEAIEVCVRSEELFLLLPDIQRAGGRSIVVTDVRAFLE